MGWTSLAHISTPEESYGPGQNHCQGAAENQRAQLQGWTICLLDPRTDSPDPGGKDQRLSETEAIDDNSELQKHYVLITEN